MRQNLFPQRPRLLDHETAAALLVILFFSLISFAYVYSLHDTDLDGDGWSHVKQARILSDSINPGYAQVGTVWLPLFHLLAAPLAANNFLWRSGLAGSFVSMLSFVFSGLGLFLILRMVFKQWGVVWLGLAIFLMNPSWLYYQTTPMQEPLSMALLVLNVLFLALWQRRARKKFLVSAALMNLLAALNRYEGWFFIAFGTLWVLVASLEGVETRSWKSRFSDAFLYGFMAALTPVYWLAHNWFEYGDALEFIRGPYSAKALYLKQIQIYHFWYPTEGHWRLSFLYYTKSVRYCAGELPFWVAAAGVVVAVARWFFKGVSGIPLKNRVLSWQSAHWLFVVPIVFYILSLAKGRAPTYVVDYYPYENFGVRYGHTPIPAIVIFAALALSFISSAVRTKWFQQTLAVGLLTALAIPVGIAVKTRLHSLPAHEEPYLNNGDDRRILDRLAGYLKSRWHGEMILMNSGYLGRIAQLDGIPYRNIIFEENREVWELTRRYPFPRITWVIAEEGDEVWEMVKTNPAYRRYYREEKMVRGIKAHVIHLYRHHAPPE